MSLPRQWSLQHRGGVERPAPGANDHQEAPFAEVSPGQVWARSQDRQPGGARSDGLSFGELEEPYQRCWPNSSETTAHHLLQNQQPAHHHHGIHHPAQGLSDQLGSLFSIHSAPVYELGGNDAPGSPKRPSSLVVQAIATSTPVVPPHLSPPETIDDEENDNLLTLSSLTARPLIAKSRELRNSRREAAAKARKRQQEQLEKTLQRKRQQQQQQRELGAGALEPLDGGYGWVVVFGAFFVQFWVAGLVKSYGVLYVEVLETFKDSSASVASWIPAILSCLCLALAPVTSMLSQKYSCRTVVFVGGLFCSLGMILSYFATRLIHLFFTFGVLTGLGGGLSTTPGIILVSQYFDKHRALANGICVSGTAAGGFVFPILIEKLVSLFGFHGTILILGGCMLHVCFSATLYRPLEDNQRSTTPDLENPLPSANTAKLSDLGEKPQEQQQQHQQQLELLFARDLVAQKNFVNEIFHQKTGSEPGIHTADSDDEKERINEIYMSCSRPIKKNLSSSLLHSVEDLSTDSTCVYKARSSLRSLRSSTGAISGPGAATDQPPAGPDGELHQRQKTLGERISRYIDLSLLRDPKFVAMCLSVSLMSTGSPYMLYYLPAFALGEGYSKSQAGYLVAISAAFDLFGRLGLGYLSDLHLFDRRKCYITSIVGAGICVLTIPIAHSFYGLAVSVGIYGLCLGCWFLMVPVLLADQYGTEKISSTYGLVRMFQSVGAITIPPLTGFLRDITGSYTVCFLGMGTCMICGGLPLLLVSRLTTENSSPTRSLPGSLEKTDKALSGSRQVQKIGNRSAMG